MYNDNPKTINSQKTKRILITLLATSIAVAILIIVFSIIKSNNDLAIYSASIRIDIQPTDASIILDGEQVSPNQEGIIRVEPGNHSIAAIRSGFFPEGEEFSVEADETYDIEYVLSPYTDEAKKMAEDFEY